MEGEETGDNEEEEKGRRERRRCGQQEVEPNLVYGEERWCNEQAEITTMQVYLRCRADLKRRRRR